MTGFLREAAAYDNAVADAARDLTAEAGLRHRLDYGSYRGLLEARAIRSVHEVAAEYDP